MFTGIIEEVGLVDQVREAGNGVIFTVRAQLVLEDLAIGDSIAIDGVCQTVTSLESGSFTVQAVATTIGRTTFGELAAGKRINLERAAALGSRLGGHLVQGHVDGVGTVRRIRRREELVLIDVEMPRVVSEVTVLHGSIAVAGISLTVNSLSEPGVVQLSIIPFTWEQTNLSDLREGDRVNLEGDLIGKYVRHLLGNPLRDSQPEHPAPDSRDLLSAWGYS